MAYEKHTWSCGETVTADLLNNMEDGIAEGGPGYTCVDGELTDVSDCFGEAVNLVIPIKRVKDDADANGGVILGNVKPEYVEDEEFINSASGHDAVAEGFGTTASGQGSHAEGNNTIASGVYSHAEGIGSSQKQTYKDNTNALPGATTAASHVEGFYTRVQDGVAGHAEGYKTLAGGGQLSGNHAEGFNTVSKGGASHAEGTDTTASGLGSHAEGTNTTSSGMGSHAEGTNTTSSGNGSHAEGAGTTASNDESHAEGLNTTSSGMGSHAEGYNTTASGIASHAEGLNTTASDNYSHAEGVGTIANHSSQHVFGEFNIADPSSASAHERGTYVEIVGNGTGNNARSNVRTLDWGGNEKLAGGLTLGLGTADEVTISAAQLKALLATLS